MTADCNEVMACDRPWRDVACDRIGLSVEHERRLDCLGAAPDLSLFCSPGGFDDAEQVPIVRPPPEDLAAR